MGKIFDTTPERLKFLVQSIHHRQVALPDCQRDLVFPLERLFGHSSAFEGWLDRVMRLRPETGDGSDDLKDRLRDVQKAWLQVVDDYEFPMVTLAEATAVEAVCTIFETLNRTGVKLSVFDLLAARFWPKDVRLRDLWDTARTAYPLLGEFEIDPYYI